MRSLLAISFNQLGIPSGDSFQHEIWGPIWRPSNSETRDPFWRSPLINLESHLAIPFNMKWGPIWRPSNSETRDPFWRSPLINLESHLAIPYYQSWYRCRSSWWQGSKLFILSFSCSSRCSRIHYGSKPWFFAIILYDSFFVSNLVGKHQGLLL
jgi:hypothetical protein